MPSEPLGTKGKGERIIQAREDDVSTGEDEGKTKMKRQQIQGEKGCKTTINTPFDIPQ